MSKKRRTNAEKFDLDRTTASVKSSEQYHANIRHHVAALRHEANIEKMLKEKAKLMEDEAISLAALRYGIKALLILKEVLQHIPSNITRVYASGIAMRLAYIHKMFNAWAPTSLNEDELNSLCSFLEAYCPDFLKSQLSAEKSEKAIPLSYPTERLSYYPELSHTKAILQGYPTELRPFLKQCGLAKEHIEEG